MNTKTTFKSQWSFNHFAQHVQNERRYIFDNQFVDFLNIVRFTSNSRSMVILKGTPVWRAQRGNDWIQLEGTHVYIPCAYALERMKPLPPFISPAGRVNPKGISCLYLSTTKETAIAEVRAGLGENISVGVFKTNRDIRIINCSKYHDDSYPIHFEEPTDDEKEKIVWTHIDKAFSAPVIQGSDIAEYIPTQIITELFKSQGYDGIVYKSAFTKSGHNIALFHLKDADLIECQLHEINAVKFESSPCDNPYYITNPLSESA